MKISKLEIETNLKKDNIIELYKQTYSVSDVLSKMKLSEGYRKYIVSMLKREGIYEGVGGKSAQYKQVKIKSTMLSKYGVENAGMMPGNGWRNDVTMNEIIFIKEYKLYSDKVDIVTKKNIKQLIDMGFCYYTGIKFADIEGEPVNPNDPLKRSVDHKISKWVGFLNNIPPENIGDIGNLVYCLKYCNTMKNNMTEESFAPFAMELRKRLINEGFESN